MEKDHCHGSVLLDNAFKSRTESKRQIGLRNHWMMHTMEYFKMWSNRSHGHP